MLDGTLANVAGYKLTDLNTVKGNKNLHLINGKAKVVKGDGVISNYLNERYSKYLGSFENRRLAIKGKGKGNGIAGSVDVTRRKTTINKPEVAPRTGNQVKQKHLTGFLKEISSRSKFNKERWLSYK